jgi:hypothetical protein
MALLGYPEGHADASDKSTEIHHLKMKVDAGADFIATQLFYDVDVYLDWYKSCRKQGEHFPKTFQHYLSPWQAFLYQFCLASCRYSLISPFDAWSNFAKVTFLQTF